MRKGWFLWLSVLFMMNLPAHAKYHLPKTPVYGNTQLALEISKVLRAHPYAKIGIFIKSMKHGDVLYAQNVDKPFVPASILKILTAESALLYLGGDYRFTTQFLTDAKAINDGTLAGNLYLVQSGDPSLTFFDLQTLMASLKAQQIDTVAGNVYIDSSAFDQAYGAPGWSLKDKQFCYGAPISASIINHNCLAFRVTPGLKAGQPAHIATSPNFYYPSLKNLVTTKARHRRGCYLKLSSFADSSLSLNGCMPKGHYAWGINYVIENVLNYNQSLVKSLFKSNRVAISGRVSPGKALSTSMPVVDHQSKELKYIVTDMLKKSDNVIAGAIFKKLGQLYSKQPGSWENGGIAVERIMAQRLGVNTKGMRVIDGSGISRYNQLTPAQMMQVLDFSYHHTPTNYQFITALPIAGVDGTLKHRLRNIARKVRAKTGTLPHSGIASLAGYAVSNTKEPIAFVIMVNGRPGAGWVYKEIEDQIAALLTQYQR